MKLITASIKYPVSTTVGVLLVSLFGIIALYKLPVQLTPEVEDPEVTVTTIWPGASPQEIEREIVDEQEEQLKALEGEENMEPQASIREATRNRIRPIFMTIGSNVFGMLPLVLFGGAGSELYRGLGAVVLGGLIVSTIFTLFLVPALFSLMLDVRAGLARRLGGIFGKTSQVAIGE